MEKPPYFLLSFYNWHMRRPFSLLANCSARSHYHRVSMILSFFKLSISKRVKIAQVTLFIEKKLPQMECDSIFSIDHFTYIR